MSDDAGPITGGLTLLEASRAVGVPRSEIRRAVENGSLPAVVVDGVPRIAEAVLLAWALRRGATDQLPPQPPFGSGART